MDETNQDEVVAPKPFVAWLQEQRKGVAHAECSDALQDLIRAVRDTGRAGKMTLTIDVKPASKGQDVVLVKDSIKLSLPEHEREEAIYFVDKDGNLSRENPNQQRLPLVEVQPRARAAGDD